MKMNATEISSTDRQILRGAASMASVVENPFSAYRVTYSVASAALIGSVYIIGGAPIGAFLLLPLMGIYTGLCVVLGRSPLLSVIEAHKPIPYVISPATEVVLDSHNKAEVTIRAA